jgi:hypothetical protein
MPNLMRKSDYHQLAAYVAPDDIDQEVVTVLDGMLRCAQSARPVIDE